MANETRLSQISQFVPEIWEGALMYAKFNFVMPSLATLFTARGWAARDVTEYKEGTIDTDLGELEDLTPKLMERVLLARLQPKEHGVQYLITDRRLETDTENVMFDAAEKIGYEMGKQMEKDLLADIANFTGGSVGTANSALTWADLYNGRARLAAAGVPGPYVVVLHEWQWLDLATAANIAALTATAAGAAAPLSVRNDIQSRYYVASMGDMNIFVSGLVPIDGNADATGGIFNRQALALDLRRGLRVEPERDASLRATELNATVVYAHGIWRPSYGVKIISDATAAGSDITTNSDLAISGFADDTTASSGQDVTLTFVVSNVGTQHATGVEVTVTVPAGATFVSDSESQGSYNSSTGVWSAGSIAVGQTAILRVVYDVTATGDFVGTISAVTPTDSVAGNNASTVSITVS